MTQVLLTHPLAHPAAVALLADDDTDKGSPIGLFVVLVLIVAVYFLYRSMNKHMRRLPESFDPPAAPSGVAPVDGTEPAPAAEDGVAPADDDHGVSTMKNP